MGAAQVLLIERLPGFFSARPRPTNAALRSYSAERRFPLVARFELRVAYFEIASGQNKRPQRGAEAEVTGRKRFIIRRSRYSPLDSKSGRASGWSGCRVGLASTG